MTYQFEGIEYEETGEVRWPNPGEYYVSQYSTQSVMLANDSRTHGVCGPDRTRKILRPVSQKFTVGERVTVLTCPEWPEGCSNRYAGKTAEVRDHHLLPENSFYETGPDIRLIVDGDRFQWPVKYIKRETKTFAPQKDVAGMPRAAFYQHVWGFPAPFEVGVKPERITEACACCTGRGVFVKTVPIMGGTSTVKEKCPECNGSGTHERRR